MRANMTTVGYGPDAKYVWGMCPWCNERVRFHIMRKTDWVKDPKNPPDELFCPKCEGWYEPGEVQKPDTMPRTGHRKYAKFPVMYIYIPMQWGWPSGRRHKANYLGTVRQEDNVERRYYRICGSRKGITRFVCYVGETDSNLIHEVKRLRYYELPKEITRHIKARRKRVKKGYGPEKEYVVPEHLRRPPWVPEREAW